MIKVNLVKEQENTSEERLNEKKNIEDLKIFGNFNRNKIENINARRMMKY